MIRININSITKREIEKIYLNDAYTAKTGIFKILEEGEIKDFLRKKHSKIYAELYCRNSTLNQENVKRLLLCLVHNKNTQSCRGDSSKLQREFPQ